MTQPATPTVLDRILRDFRALVRAEDPNRKFFGTYEYAVEAADGQVFSGRPTEQSLGLPDASGWPYGSGPAGMTYTPPKGSLAYIQFVNGDPARPMVFGWGTPPAVAGPFASMPLLTRIDAVAVVVGDPAGSPLAVARETDPVEIGYLSGVANLMTGAVTFSLGVTPPIVPFVHLTGNISGGSDKLSSE